MKNKDKKAQTVSVKALHETLDSIRTDILHNDACESLACLEKLDEMDTLLHQLADSFMEIVHDIKTPLMVIAGRIAILKRQISGNKKWDSSLECILGNTKKVEKMVYEILVLSDVLHHEDEADHCDAEKVIADCLSTLEIIATQREIVISKETSSMQVAMDRFSLWRIMMNLIENALKYSVRGSTVAITMKESTRYGRGEIVIENFSESQFITGLNSNSPSAPGAKGCGIGLHLCEKLAAAHGATLKIEPGTDHTVWTTLHVSLLKWK